MDFVNRREEINIIADAQASSSKKLYTLLISGNRRIGKTRLILEKLSSKDLYFFVNKDKMNFQLLKEYQDIFKFKNILNELESLNNWDDFFNVLFKRFKGIAVFDEFQNFLEVDPSVYGLLQKYLDLNENRKNLLLVFLGSNIGLIKKTLQDKKSPLYGRIKRTLFLKQLTFQNIIKFCKSLKIKNIEEVIMLYSIFGGYPKYYVSIEDERLIGKTTTVILNRFFFDNNALLEDEVMNILSLEFGKRRGVYYDILSAIASGNTKPKAIAAFLNKKETAISRQFNELLNYFEIIDYKKQLFGKRKIYFIKHPLINFWLRFFHKDLSYYTQRHPMFLKKFKEQFNIFLGEKFEEVCAEILMDMNKKKVLPFFIEKIGKEWWTKEYMGEMDIVGINEKAQKILLCECKWKERVNPLKILNKLKNKTNFIHWHKKRKEYFLIFAKSFSFKIKEALCVDLTNILDFYGTF